MILSNTHLEPLCKALHVVEELRVVAWRDALQALAADGVSSVGRLPVKLELRLLYICACAGMYVLYASVQHLLV